jgi:large subunit ribosomal protein L23
MINTVLVRPLITEKTQLLANKGKYVFVVKRNANKIEIGKAIEHFYNVTVEDVNTTIISGKMVSRSGKSGVITGRKSTYKKAIVTLADGDSIDIFINPNQDLPA